MFNDLYFSTLNARFKLVLKISDKKACKSKKSGYLCTPQTSG